MDPFEQDRQKILRTLESELLEDDSSQEFLSAQLKKALGNLDQPIQDGEEKLYSDLATSCGLVGAWHLALEIIEKIRQKDVERSSYRIFHMQCFLKLGRYHDVLSLAQAAPWPKSDLIHVNYLMGCAFQESGLLEQARQRFEAVKKQDASYADILLRLQKV